MVATSETGVIVFYNTDFRLLLINLRGENTKKAYWVSETPERIVADLQSHLTHGKQKLRYLIVQDPETLPTIAPTYYDYNRFKMLPEDLLRTKIVAARRFLEIARDRVPQAIPRCKLEVVDVGIDDFIRDATTHQIIPPQAADSATQLWITENFRVGVIRCEQDGRVIPCPICWHEQFLRGWKVPDHTIALCYNCGAKFFCDNGQVLQEFAGNRCDWGAQGIILAITLQERLKTRKI